MKRLILSILLASLLTVGIFAADVLYEQNFDEYSLAVGDTVRIKIPQTAQMQRCPTRSTRAACLQTVSI